MKKNQKGFSAIESLLLLVILGVLCFAGWFFYQSNQNSIRPAVNDSGTGNKENECSKKGIIIVMFNSGVSKERQTEIINTEKSSINKEYDSFNGYALNVTKDKEQEAVNAFRKYAEVKTANLNDCNTTNSTQ